MYVGISKYQNAIRSESIVIASTNQSAINNISYNPGAIEVFKNGVKLVPGIEVTATDGTNILFATTLNLGDKIDIVSNNDTTSGFVTSINGQSGSVNLTTSIISEGTNLYYTNARASAAAPVQSVAGRTGNIVLVPADINGLTSFVSSLAPVTSVAGRTGSVTLTTSDVAEGSNLYFTNARASAAAPVQSVAGRTGNVTFSVADVSGAAPLASPALTGSPTAPTQSAGDNSTKLATTGYVQSQGYATTGFVTSQGYATTGFVTGQGYTTSSAVTSAITTAFSNSGFGVGQNWQDVTGSRSFNTTYTNNTGKPIVISASYISVVANVAFSFSTVVNGITVSSGSYPSGVIVQFRSLIGSEYHPIIVPVGGTYSLNFSYTNTSTHWWEFR